MSVLPAACYYSCALPGLLAQVDGKAGADLCALPCYVNFNYALEECRRCLVKRNSPQTVVIDAIPQYQQFIGFCSGYLNTTTPGQCYFTATGTSLRTTTRSAYTYTTPLSTVTPTTEVITYEVLSTSNSTYSSITYPSVPSSFGAEGYVTTTTVSTISGPLVTAITVQAGSNLTVTEAKTVFDIQVLSITSEPASTDNEMVICPSRITNPTYTPSAPLPNNYTWGCPPGLVCVPSQDQCNVEPGLPAEGYICSPTECLVAPYLETTDSLQPITKDLFYLNPELFGLTYEIFLVQVLTTSIITIEKSTSTYTLSASTTVVTSTTAATSTTVATSTSSSKLSGGVIAGVTIGAVAGFTLLIGLITFIVLRRRRQQRLLRDEANAAEASQVEKAQLHSQDVKPDRKEMQGEGGPKFLKPLGPPAEMATNEEVIRRELPVNELTGAELEVKQNATSEVTTMKGGP